MKIIHILAAIVGVGLISACTAPTSANIEDPREGSNPKSYTWEEAEGKVTWRCEQIDSSTSRPTGLIFTFSLPTARNHKAIKAADEYRAKYTTGDKLNYIVVEIDATKYKQTYWMETVLDWKSHYESKMATSVAKEDFGFRPTWNAQRTLHRGWNRHPARATRITRAKGLFSFVYRFPTHRHGLPHDLRRV